MASTASATFHLMKIREVATGSGANTSFVELQMYAPVQQFLAGHQITVYNGTALTSTYTFPALPVPTVVNGASQSTILVGDSGAAGSPDFTQAGFVLNPGAGAACFDAIPVDCVGWGTGTTATLPGTVGSPAAALTSTMALRRSIQPGCPTLLEAADDTDNSATDFSLQAPMPRNNSVTPTEVACASSGGGAPPTYAPAPGTYTPAKKKKCKKHKKKPSGAYAAKKKCKKHRK
jgi:hypothetical protein